MLKQNFRRHLSLVVVVTLCWSSAALSNELCVRTFQVNTLEISKDLKPAYVENFILNLYNKYVVKEVQPRTPILNQGTRGFCHMYSLHTELTREFMQRHNGENPNVSIYYWAYHHWFQRAMQTAMDPKSGTTIPEGSWYEITFDLIKKVGVMTNDQWAALGGKTDIETRYKNSIESGMLKDLMIESQRQVRYFETFLGFEEMMSKLPTIQEKRKAHNEFYNNVESNHYFEGLKKFVLAKSALLASKKTAFTKEQLNYLRDLSDHKIRSATKEQKEALMKALQADIQKDVEVVFASMFFGQDAIPKQVVELKPAVELSKQMFPEMHQTTITIGVSEQMKENGPTRMVGKQPGVNGEHLYFDASIKTLADVIVNEIDNGNGVWIGYDHNDNFVDVKAGAMTIGGLKQSPRRPYESRMDRDRESIYEGGHAVQLVGYIKDAKTGEVVGFKMQNSWGEEVGQAGYFTMDMDYFRAFIWRVTIRDEKGLIQGTVSQDRRITEAEQKKDGFLVKPIVIDSKLLFNKN